MRVRSARLVAPISAPSYWLGRCHVWRSKRSDHETMSIYATPPRRTVCCSQIIIQSRQDRATLRFALRRGREMCRTASLGSAHRPHKSFIILPRYPLLIRATLAPTGRPLNQLDMTSPLAPEVTSDLRLGYITRYTFTCNQTWNKPLQLHPPEFGREAPVQHMYLS